MIVTPLAATPGSKCCEIILIFHRHHWGKKPSWLTTTGKPGETTGNPSKTTNQFGTAEASSGYPPGHATEWIFPPMGETGTGLVNSLKWIIATLVGEAPLFSHRLLLLVTSTGFRSCQRQRVMSVVLDLLRVNLKNSRHIVANGGVRVWDGIQRYESKGW